MRRVVAVVAITAFALLLAPTAAAGGGCHWESAQWTTQASEAKEVTAHIAGCRYEPTTLHIQPGTTVTWLNKDPVPHSVTGPFLTLNGDSLLNQGESATMTFGKEGVYPYYCVLHPGMAASVVVGDSEESVTGVLGAISDESGKYDSSGPIEGATTADEGASSMVPLAVGVAGIAVIGVATVVVMMRRRRRAVPVPGALP